MSPKYIGVTVAGLGVALALTACGPSPQDGPPASTSSVAFSTIPAPPSVPAPAPLHDDPTATLTINEMSTALGERGVQWDARDVIMMGTATITDYLKRAAACEESGSWFDACGSRDAQRSGLPSRCITEAERTDTMPDFGACGLAIEYVKVVEK